MLNTAAIEFQQRLASTVFILPHAPVINILKYGSQTNVCSLHLT